MENALLEVFRAFAAGPEMDGRSFIKCLKDAGLIDGSVLKTADADLIFVKCKEKGARKLGFADFARAIEMVAARKGVPDVEVMHLIAKLDGPNYDTGSNMGSGVHAGLGSQSSASPMGPERFFYDKSTYTGTHRHGGPTVVGGGVSIGDVVRDNDLVNREVVLEDGLHRKKSGSLLPVLLGGLGGEHHGEAAAEKTEPRRSNRRPKSPVGPERFFYDKSTYTGTHRNGGPTTMGSGLSKRGGYDDLSQLVNRAHVQDDALHRKKEVEPTTSEVAGSVGSIPVSYAHRQRSQPQPKDSTPRRQGGGAGPLPDASRMAPFEEQLASPIPISTAPVAQVQTLAAPISHGGYPMPQHTVMTVPLVTTRYVQAPPVASGYAAGAAVPIAQPLAVAAAPHQLPAYAPVTAMMGHPMLPIGVQRWGIPMLGTAGQVAYS